MQQDRITEERSEAPDVERVFSISSRPPKSRFQRAPMWRSVRAAVSRSGFWKRYASVVICMAASAIIGFMGGLLAVWRSNSSGILSSSLSSQKQIVSSESQLIANIAKTVGPSVVSVNVTSTSQNTDSFFGFGPVSQDQKSAGTGIILTAQGLVITNRHVVPAGTTDVSITLSDGTKLDDVTVVGRTGASSTLDVAFLKINNTKGKKLTPAQLGDSTKVQVGDDVVAIGNALGQFQNTVTAGIISGYGRSVQASSSSGLGQGSESLDDLFQTDAAINEGNSGGPLVNLNGQVIGINTAIAGDAQNIGFAIPINDVIGLVQQVEKSGKLQQPYLGVRYIPVTDDIAQQYNLHVSRGAWVPPSGVVGQDPVVADGPAAKAGVHSGDIITQIDGSAIDENTSLTSIIDKKTVGQEVDLTIVRDGKTVHVQATLGIAPTDD